MVIQVRINDFPMLIYLGLVMIKILLVVFMLPHTIGFRNTLRKFDHFGVGIVLNAPIQMAIQLIFVRQSIFGGSTVQIQ